MPFIAQCYIIICEKVIWGVNQLLLEEVYALLTPADEIRPFHVTL